MAADAPHTVDTPRIAAEVARQHVELAAFLWAQRDTLSLDDPPDSQTIERLDQRIEANLDGLRIAGRAAWPLIDIVVGDFPEKGEVFVASWLAIEQSDSPRLDVIVDLALKLDQPRGLVGALGWHRLPTIANLLRAWLGERDGFRRYLGLAACTAHKVDPKQWLDRLVGDPDPRVRAIALKLVGLLRRSDLADPVADALGSHDEAVRLWAGWALVELGRGARAGVALREAAAGGGPDALFALRAAVKAGSESDVRAWLGGLMQTPATAPVAVRGIGMLGDRSVLPWLIERMREPHVAVAATAAFLELFPEARGETKLFTANPEEVAPGFAEHFQEEIVTLVLPKTLVAQQARLTGRTGNP